MILALLAPGVGGSVASEEVAAGRFKELLLNPAALIKPVCEWGDLLTAPVHACDDEWDAIGEYLLRCGVAEVIDDSQLIYHRGKLLAAGAFGVRKPGKTVKVKGKELPVLRLIVNMTPSNAVALLRDYRNSHV
eukprot:6096233-Amphidinium_carterae.1